MMKTCVMFTSNIIGSDFKKVESLIGLFALDGIIFMEIEVPDFEDYESMADIIEGEFTKKYPDKYYTSYTVKMPNVA